MYLKNEPEDWSCLWLPFQWLLAQPGMSRLSSSLVSEHTEKTQCKFGRSFVACETKPISLPTIISSTSETLQMAHPEPPSPVFFFPPSGKNLVPNLAQTPQIKWPLEGRENLIRREVSQNHQDLKPSDMLSSVRCTWEGSVRMNSAGNVSIC